MKQVYLDYAAATPVDERVMRAMKPYFSSDFFNPSAPYLPAVNVKRAYLAAKSQIARAIGTKADNLIMTAGATEAINLAFNGREDVVISGIEHPAVVKVAQSKKSCQISKVGTDGIVDLDDLLSRIADQTELVALSLVSSDLGTIQPVSKLAQAIKQINNHRLERGISKKLLLFVDASQALGSIKLNLGRLGADLVVISAAKIYGPKQTAALWVNPGTEIEPLIIGGGQELGLRAGTENVPFVIGMAEAIRLLDKNYNQQISKLRDQLQAYLLEKLPFARVIGNQKKRLPNYLVISLGQIEAERLIYRLEECSIYVSTGAACSANSQTDSLALTSIGLPKTERDSSLRISLGRGNDQEQIDYAKKIIVEQVLAEKERIDD